MYIARTLTHMCRSIRAYQVVNMSSILEDTHLPIKEKIGVSWPTKQDNPILGQPPESLNSVQTAWCEVGVPITQRGTRMAKNPRM